MNTAASARSVATGAAAFVTTHWSVVLAAQGESAAAEEALEKLCRTYWWPLYGFVRRQGYAPEEAQDLTQGFFAMLLERRDLDAVPKGKGAPALLPPRVTKEFSRQSASSGDDCQAR